MSDDDATSPDTGTEANQPHRKRWTRRDLFECAGVAGTGLAFGWGIRSIFNKYLDPHHSHKSHFDFNLERVLAKGGIHTKTHTAPDYYNLSSGEFSEYEKLNKMIHEGNAEQLTTYLQHNWDKNWDLSQEVIGRALATIAFTKLDAEPNKAKELIKIFLDNVPFTRHNISFITQHKDQGIKIPNIEKSLTELIRDGYHVDAGDFGGTEFRGNPAIAAELDAYIQQLDKQKPAPVKAR